MKNNFSEIIKRYRTIFLRRNTFFNTLKFRYYVWLRYNSLQDPTINKILFQVEDAPEDGYTAKALGYSIYTEANTWDEQKISIQDALSCHFEESKKTK